MKTSKKILSFILAVVLVVTTCSVGFTAFAADDTTNAYWTDKNKTDAEDAFQSLNNVVDYVLPSLLGIEINDGTLADVLGIDDPSSASLSDVVKGASPLLMGVLGIAKADDSQKKQIIMDHLKTSSYNGMYDKYFSYLNDDEAQISFFDLYQFCKDNKTSSTDTTTLGGWCNETLKTLDTYLDLYDAAVASVSKPETAYAKLTADKSVEKTAAKKLNGIAYADLADSSKNPDSYKDYAQGVENANAFFKKMGVDLEIKDPAEALYYYYSQAADDFVNGIIAIYLANGKISDDAIASSSTKLTTSNVMGILADNLDAFAAENASSSIDKPTFIKEHLDIITETGIGDLPPVKDMTAEEAQAAGYMFTTGGKTFAVPVTGWPVQLASVPGTNDPDVKNDPNGAANSPLRFYFYINPSTNKLMKLLKTSNMNTAQNAIAEPYYQAFLAADSDVNTIEMYGKMLKACYMDITGTDGKVENTSLGVYNSKFYTTMVENALKETGLYDDVAKAIADAKITDDQINAASAYAIENEIDTNTKFQDFIKSGNNPFSAEVTSFLTSITNATTNQALANALNKKDNLGNSSSKSVAELFKAVAYDVAPYNQQGVKTVYDIANFSISSVMLYDYVGTAMIGANATACQNGTKTANAPVIYKEIYKYLLVEPKLNDDNNKFSYTGSVVIPDTFSVDLVNSTINGYIDLALSKTSDIGAIVAPIVEALTESLNVDDLHDSLFDVWKNLAENPISTVFNLLPIVVIALDELLIPILLNQPQITDGALAHDKDAYYNLVYDAVFAKDSLIQIPALQALTLEGGNTAIGISQLSFDLNSILPAIIEWFKYNDGTDDGKDTAFAKANAFVDTYADRGYATIIEKDGENETTVDGSKVLSFTGIYVADKAIMGVSLNKLLKESSLDEQVATGLVEIIDTVIDIADTAVLDYLDEQKADPSIRYTNDGNRATEGLNDIFVALPQLIDKIGKGLIDHFNVDSDWTYCFDGKIYKDEHKKAEGKTVVRNKSLEMFKDTTSAKNSAVVLETFVDIFIGHQLNAFLDLFNDIFADPNNDITKNLPLVQSLLMALGGLGEQSIITDLVDGLFQLKRSDDVSFQLAERDATGFVGFSTESGIYLIANLFSEIDAKKPANNKGIVPFIINLIGDEKTATSGENASLDSAALLSDLTKALAAPSAPYLTLSSKNAKYDKTLTKSNIAQTQELIDKIDTLLASLLKDTTINGFDLTSTDSILSGVISAVSNYIGADNTSKLVELIDQYLTVVVSGNEKSTTGKVDANKLYTSEKLTSLVSETYCLIEEIVDYLLGNALNGKDPNGIIADAICGIISPDAVGVRMTEEYKTTAKILLKDENLTWSDVKANTDDLKFGFSNGSKDGFYHALGESLNGIAAIVGALLTATYTSEAKTDNYYSALIYPVLSKLSAATGAPALMTPSKFNSATDAEKLVDGIIAPLANLLGQLYDAPASFLLNLIKGLAAVLEDESIEAVITNAIAPIKVLLNGVVNVVATLSPTLAKYLEGVLDDAIISKLDITLPSKNIFATLITSIEIDGVAIGSYVAVESMDFAKVANAKSPAEVLLIIYAYLVDTVLESDILSLFGLDADLVDELNAILAKLSSDKIIGILSDAIDVCKTPTEVYWTFREYASKLTGEFTYPKTITKKESEKAIKQIDGIVNDVFPLLNKLGVTDISGLSALVNDNLYTNEILTTIATAVYGAIENAVNGNKDVADVLKMTGMDFSPNGLAKYLTDSSYGTTFSSAATTLKKAKTWADVKKINWGFTNGSSKAQKGFINGLAALVRPVNGVLSIFLAEGTISPELAKILTTTVNSLDINEEFKISEDSDFGCTLKLTIKNAQLTLVIDSNNSNDDSIVKLNLKNVLNTLVDTVNEIKLGTNGYEGAIVPILEAFMCKNVKTYSQYKADIKSAKDNLVIDVLTPIFGLVNDVIANPIDTVTKILPNVAYFIDSNGLMQAIGNLLAPITAKNGLLGVLNKYGLNIDTILKSILGKSLGTLITDALDIDVKLNLQLTNLAACNIQDILYPLINKLISGIEIDGKAIGLTLPEFTFKAIASHGKLKTGIKSAAKNSDGEYITQQVVANQGEVLISILRYVADVLIQNTGAIKNLLVGIDAIKDNETIKAVVEAVLGQINSASPDDFVRAIFYFLTEEATDSYYDYSNYKGGKNTFDYGTIDAAFCAQLGSQLDGIVGKVFKLLSTLGVANIESIAAIVNDNLYTDDLITTIATGLFGAIDGVDLGEMGTLADVLALTDIDFTTAGVAKLLKDKSYGKQYTASAKVIAAAKNWKDVNASKLTWGVTDRASFLNALCAILRPVYGVLDVLFNDGALKIFDLVSIPGSNGYESTLVPILEALGVEGLKTMAELKADAKKAYDNILLDVLNPVFDKIEEVFDAPFSTLAGMLPSIGLYIANGGYVQSVANLLTPVSALLDALKPIVDINVILDALGITELTEELGITLDIYDLKTTLAPLADSTQLVPLINLVLSLLIDEEIVLPDIDWYALASHGEYKTVASAARNAEGKFERKTVEGDVGETLLAVLRYVEKTLITNANSISSLLLGIDAIKNNATIKNVIEALFNNISKQKTDSLVKSIFYFLEGKTTNAYFDYSDFKFKSYDFDYDNIDPTFCAQLANQIDGAIGNVFSLLKTLGVANITSLTTLVNGVLYTDNIVSTIATALYKALDGVKLGDLGTLPDILGLVGINCTTKDFAALLTDKSYGKQFKDAAKVIGAAKSWKDVDASKLKWGVTDQDSFLEALVAILRPLEGVLDVIFNSGALSLYDIVSIPGSNGYENALAPILEALGVEGLPTQAELNKSAAKAHDNLLLDILKPLFNKINDILEAPVATVAKMIPAVAYFIANDGLIQALDNLLTPITALLKAVKPIVNVNDLLEALDVDINELLSGIGLKTNFDIYDLPSTLKPIMGAGKLLPVISKLVADIKINGKKLGITIPKIDWFQLASHGEEVTLSSVAKNKQGEYTRKTVDGNVGETLLAVLRYVENLLTLNANTINDLLGSIDAIKNNATISKILGLVFGNISEAGFDDILRAIFYFFQNKPRDTFFDYSEFQTKANDFSFGELDEEFCRKLAPMLDGLINGLLGDKGGLNGLIGGLLYKDDLVSKLATGLYGAIEGVKLGDSLNLNTILNFLDIDFTTSKVASLLVDPSYGKAYPVNAAVIKAAGSWSKVNPASLHWGVNDRASFEQALVAVLRPLYGVLDVLLNDGSLNLANIVSVPGSDGYSSTIVPLLEAFNCINIRTQYQYRLDMSKSYDAILLDVLDPLLDKVEDILNAPIEMVADILPNLALFFANDGLLQIIDNLLTPVSAILDSLRPVLDVNELLDALGLDVSALLAKAGLNINVEINLYDLKGTLRPLIGADNIVGLLNKILGIINIKGAKLGIVLPEVDWLKLASHGELVRIPSQAATHGTRMLVKADQDETLIAVLRFIIDTINYQGNYDAIVNLLGGLLGGLSDSIAGVVDQVLGMLKGDSDEVILNLVDLLQTIAG